MIECGKIIGIKIGMVVGNQMISIIMPAYNSENFVSHAIDSVLHQTYQHFELIVCDDGSTDKTLEIVEGYAKRNPYIRLIRNNFCSVSLNANSGVAAARYPWVARLDADDLATPNRLELQIQAAQREPHVVCWGGAAHLINRNGERLRTARLGPETEMEFQELRRSGHVIYMLGLTTMIRRDAFLQVGGYDPRFNSADDIELLSRLAELGSIRALPAILGYYRIHGNSFTASRSIIQERLFRFIEARNKAHLAGGDLELEAYMEGLDQQPLLIRLHEALSGHSRQYYHSAKIGFAEHRAAQAIGWGILALLADPISTVRRLQKKAETGGKQRSLSRVR
jgi:glycosyltransferase involved in cell wall biosynthesis